MEQINKRAYFNFFLLFLMIAFSAFEYFFRDGTPYLILSFFIIIISLRKIRNTSSIVKNLYFTLFLIFFLQGVFLSNYSIIGCFTRMIPWISSLCLAFVINCNFKKYYVRVISFIAAYSLIIYLLSYIPSIREYLIYKICPIFPSLNLTDAIQEGGGDNFIIYNFQKDYLNENIGFYRNCGPFWEPGMFSCFLNLALFINLNFNGNKWISLLLIGASISTFSTGGLICLLFVIFSYVQSIGKNNIFISLLGFILILFAIQFYFNTSFIGTKVLEQLDKASVGSDQSRFGAILTQIKMIEVSPIIGGENIKDYSESGTLASSLLLPFVNFGIIIGFYFYILLFKSCIKNTYIWGGNRKKGIYLFILIILMSISQTITLNIFILLMMICGLTNNRLIKYQTINKLSTK